MKPSLACCYYPVCMRKVKVIGSVCLSARDLDIQALFLVLSCDELSKIAKCFLLCSQALCIACELYKSLAIVDCAYRPNPLLQSLLRILKLCMHKNAISQNIS